MKVILTDDVVGLGDIGESVSVRSGYARNFLIPRGLAIETGSANARTVAHRLRQIEAKKKRMKGSAVDRANVLRELTVVLELRVGSNGRVFGSLSARDIAQKLSEMGHEFDRRRVLLAEPIKKLGEHTVRVKLHSDVETDIRVDVRPREASTEEEAAVIERARQSLEAGAEARGEADESESE